MATDNTLTTLDGNFKEVYADSLEKLTPKGIKFTKDIDFVPREQQPGNSFHQPVLLAHEQGFSYSAAGPTGAFPLELNAAVAGQVKDATVSGAQILLRSRMGYEAAARASSGGTRAFRRAVDIVVENMWESAKKRCEISTLYGQAGIGLVEKDGGSRDSTTNTIYVNADSWAPGIWLGLEGASLRVFGAGTNTQNGADAPITAIDAVDKKITVTGQGSTTWVDGDEIYLLESRDADGTHRDQLGIHATLDYSGTDLHGIANDSTGFALWKGVEKGLIGALTIAKINEAIAECVGNGLDEDVNVYVNPQIWNDLQTTELGQRRFTSQPKRGSYQVGSEGLEFYTQSGKISIKSSIYVKQGNAYILSPRLWKRVGATDLTFNLPDRGDEFFLHVQDAAAYELRCYSNQAVFTKAPAKAALLSGITT